MCSIGLHNSQKESKICLVFIESNVSLRYWTLCLVISGHVQLKQATFSIAVYFIFCTTNIKLHLLRFWIITHTGQNILWYGIVSLDAHFQTFGSIVRFHLQWQLFKHEEGIIFFKRRKTNVKLHAVASQIKLILSNTPVITSDIKTCIKFRTTRYCGNKA